MYIFGDIGNSETKLFLVNKKEKIQLMKFLLEATVQHNIGIYLKMN